MAHKKKAHAKAKHEEMHPEHKEHHKMGLKAKVAEHAHKEEKKHKGHKK